MPHPASRETFGDYVLLGIIGPIFIVGALVTLPLWGTAYVIGRYVSCPLLDKFADFRRETL